MLYRIGTQNNDVKRKQCQLIGADGVSDTCISLEYFVAIFQVKVIRGHKLKKFKVLNFGKLVLQNTFLGQISSKNTNDDPKTLTETWQTVKNKSWKIMDRIQKRGEKWLLFLTRYMS